MVEKLLAVLLRTVRPERLCPSYYRGQMTGLTVVVERQKDAAREFAREAVAAELVVERHEVYNNVFWFCPEGDTGWMPLVFVTRTRRWLAWHTPRQKDTR